jgi:hypothetical protein
MRKVPLAWEDDPCWWSFPRRTEGTFPVHAIWSGSKIAVSCDGKGVIGLVGGSDPDDNGAEQQSFVAEPRLGDLGTEIDWFRVALVRGTTYW